MAVEAPQVHEKTVSEVRNVAVSFVGKLDAGELLTGTPTITESTSVLTLGNKVVNTVDLTILGETVAVGKAVQFSIAGGTAGTQYTIKISVGTTSTPAQTLIARVLVNVIAD